MILFAGGYLVDNSETGMFFVVVATFGVSIGVLESLESRQRRKEGRDREPAPR